MAVHDALAAPQLTAPEPVAAAYRQVVDALVATLHCLNQQITGLDQQLARRFSAHPDAAVIHSQPGLGVVPGARVLAEFGDDPHRYARRSPVPHRSPDPRGLRTTVVARAACNQPLEDACYIGVRGAVGVAGGAALL